MSEGQVENAAPAEEKRVKFEDGKLIVSESFEKSVDPNKDGEPLAHVKISGEFYVNVTEIPDEAIDFWKSKKEKKEG